MVVTNDLSPGHELPAPMTVEVTGVNWNVEERRAEVRLIDSVGDGLRLVDYEGANLSVDWSPNHRYRISRCGVNVGGGSYDVELAPSKKTRVEHLGIREQVTKILVIGDTHVGRRKHPGTGEKIEPINPFRTAVEHGIDLRVDAVAHVGDIFHDSATSSDTAQVDTQVFAPLREERIPFYYVTGNHGSAPSEDLLARKADDGVVNLGTSGIAVGPEVRLFGINHYQMGNIDWHDIQFPDTVDEAVSILLLHQTLEQLSEAKKESVDLERTQKRASNRFDLVLCGHHHDATSRELNGTRVMYTGATEKMSTNFDPVDRVAWIVRIENGLVSYERYDIP